MGYCFAPECNHAQQRRISHFRCFFCDIWRTTVCLASHAGVFREARFSSQGWKTSSLKTSAWEATVCWDLEILLPWQPDVTTSLSTLGLDLYEPALFTMPRTKPLSRGTALLRYNNPQNHLMGDPIWVSYPRNILGGARAIGGSV